MSGPLLDGDVALVTGAGTVPLDVRDAVGIESVLGTVVRIDDGQGHR